MAVILVCDDQPDHRELLEVYLKRAGHSVVMAENGREAFDAAVENPPDLVFIDLMMPSMNGLDFAKCAKDHTLLRHVPIILVTAAMSSGATQPAAYAPADALVGKPWDWEELETLLETYLPPAAS